jgi:hypothetical protein
MKSRLFLDPIDLMKQIRYKYLKESNYVINRYTKQVRRTTKQLITKYKDQFKAETA